MRGGITTAVGSPKRVTRTGRRVLRTLSRMAEQATLNLEMAICSIRFLSPELILPWSMTIVLGKATAWRTRFRVVCHFKKLPA